MRNADSLPEHSFRWWWPGGRQTVTIEVDLPEDGNETEVGKELRDLISMSSGFHSGDALADAFSEFGQRHGLRMEPVDIVSVERWQIRFVR